jgi:Leucine-rich repeat (LRR) protein
MGTPGNTQEAYLICNQKGQTSESDWSWSLKSRSKFIPSAVRDLLFDRLKITSFQSEIFTKFTNVRKIDLSRNELNTIDFNEFAENSKLEILDVSQNQIAVIAPIRNSTQISISSLMIHDNALTDISELCKLKKVKSLKLSKNRRLDYSKVTFSCWSELTYLYLAETGLKKLNHDYRVLAGCNKLDYLDLSDNKLKLLCFEHFPALPNLTDLNIRNNSLTNLDVLALKRKCKVLSTIRITGNKWICGYYWKTMEKELDESKITGITWNKNDCLKSSENPKMKSCEGEGEKTKLNGILFVPFWIIFTLDFILFIILLMLL